MRASSRILLACALAPLAPPAPAAAQDAAKASRGPTKPELAAMATVERELLGLAKAASQVKDPATAEREVRLGLDVWPEAPKLGAELERLRKLAAKGRAGAAPAPRPEGDPLGTKRDAAYAAAGKALADAARAITASHPDRADRYWDLVRTRFPSPEALEGVDLVFCAPRATWVARETATRIEAGEEWVDGKWLDAKAVEALDRLHATWDTPWVLADEAHEVRAIVPLRRAREILAWAGQCRRHLLERFCPPIDLRQPKGKLPIIVTNTRAELDERLRVHGAGYDETVLMGTACFVRSERSLDPLFVCLECRGSGGSVAKVHAFEPLRVDLTSALVSQVLAEFSRYAATDTRGIESHIWTVYAVSKYLGFLVRGADGWRVARPKELANPTGRSNTPFGWCRAHPRDVPPIREFLRLPNDGFRSSDHNLASGVLGWFMLEGEGGKYATRFLLLLQDVARVQDAPGLFDKHFAGVDPDALQAEWERFVSAITFTE